MPFTVRRTFQPNWTQRSSWSRVLVEPTLATAWSSRRIPSRTRSLTGRGSARAVCAVGHSSFGGEPDLDVVDIRGNVDTRIGLLGERGLDAVILAVAGIHRLRRAKEITRILPTSTFLPAPAQGALAVLARADDTPVVSAVRRINHPATFQCISAERSFAAALGGDCRVPLGALATDSMRTVSLVGEVLNPAGQRHLRRRRVGPASEGKNLGSNLGKDMLKEGALELLGAPRR